MLWKRLVMVMVVLIVLAPAVLAPRTARADDWVRYIRRQTEPAGWTRIRYEIVATWCDTSGQCGTAWQPSSQVAIFEKKPDRQFLEHGEGDDSPPYPPVGYWPRLLCVDGQWAAGTWYHNATFDGGWRRADRYTSWDNEECRGEIPCTVEVWEETWTMRGDYSNFGPEDEGCRGGGEGGGGGGGATPVPTVPPRPTDRPRPTVRPTDRPVIPLPDPWSEEVTYPPAIELGYFPPYPIIVGQDITRMGVTLYFSVTTWPVETVYHWYTCEHPPAQPNMCYVGTIVEHTQVTYSPDPPDLEETWGWMKLSEESKSWIERVLGPKFGVRVLHPDWEIPPYPGWDWTVEGPLGDRTYRAYGHGTILAEDPGWYRVDLLVTTEYGVQGHFPIPLPLVGVTGFGVTLIK